MSSKPRKFSLPSVSFIKCSHNRSGSLPDILFKKGTETIHFNSSDLKNDESRTEFDVRAVIETDNHPADVLVRETSEEIGDEESSIMKETNWLLQERKESTENAQELGLNTDKKYKGMVKTHYVDKSQRDTCQRCQKPFTLKRIPKHCRRCGDIFCLKCLQFRMKLNVLANPDPEGKTRKVCRTCLEKDELVFGCTRSLLSEFIEERQFAKHANIIKKRVEYGTTSFWPDQVNRREECKRLLAGFREEITELGLVRVLQGLKVKLKTPSWQKSKHWINEQQLTDKCRVCHGSLGLRKSSGSCRVCGLALCKPCSSRELLLYLADDTDVNTARLVVINVFGAPSNEPKISLLLYICQDCKLFITKEQLASVQWYTEEPVGSLLDVLLSLDADFAALQQSISTVKDKIEDILNNTESEEVTIVDSESLRRLFETFKHNLAVFDRNGKKLKSLQAKVETKSQATLLNNYTKCKHSYFVDTISGYRSLKAKIERVSKLCWISQ